MIDAKLFEKYTKPKKGKYATERGELIQYFTDRLNATRDGKKYKKLSYAAVAVKLSHLKQLQDLYFLKSTLLDAERRGFPWSAIFWKEIRPQKQP
jgi:hypothetical protein